MHSPRTGVNSTAMRIFLSAYFCRYCKKIQHEKAKVLLIALVWRTQPWYPMLLQLLCNIPRLLPMDWDKGMVVSPTQKDFIMPTGVPQLAAWPLSGNNVDQKDFQKQLQGYSQLPGGTKQSPIMTLSSNVGIAGVTNA